MFRQRGAWVTIGVISLCLIGVVGIQPSPGIPEETGLGLGLAGLLASIVMYWLLGRQRHKERL